MQKSDVIRRAGEGGDTVSFHFDACTSDDEGEATSTAQASELNRCSITVVKIKQKLTTAIYCKIDCSPRLRTRQPS